MAIRKISAVLGIASLMLAFTGAAVAKVPTPVVVAHSVVAGTPQMFIDSKGTQNMVWTTLRGHDQDGNSYFAVGYARKPKGAKHFTQVKLTGIFEPENPLLYQAAPGVLQILVNGFASNGGTGGTFAWRSSNDGKSWTVMNTSALNNPSLTSDGVYINEENMTVVPGGPVTATGGGGGGPVIQLNANLTGWTQIATVGDTMGGLPKFARSLSGTLYMTGFGSTESEVPFQIGNNTTGQVTFPTCPNDGSVETLMTAGRSVAVVAAAGCGHVWVHTISPSGKVGPLVRLGSESPNGEDQIAVVADHSGHFTAVWPEPGGDLGVAHSSNGSHWKVPATAVAIAPNGLNGTVSAGVATWYSFSSGNYEEEYGTKVRTIALSETYRLPKPPSAKGMSRPHRGRLGSFAASVPGRIGLKGFRKNGHVTVRVVDAFAGKVTIAVSDSRVKGDTTYDICEGSRSVKLAAHRAKTVTVSCQASTGIVLTRPRVERAASSGIDARKGDTVGFTFGSRNGGLGLTGKVA